jgi:hypothetical protein
VNALAELFPDEDHRLHLALRRGDVRAFFASTPSAPRILAERNHLLDTEAARHAALLPEGEPLRAAFASLVGEHHDATVVQLGRRLEPDFLLLGLDGGGTHRLLGGALCFPTGWSLTAQLGRPLEAIHGVVPKLNATLGSPIQQFLSRLKPGTSCLRANWGLSATDELNLHPEVARPRLAPGLDVCQIWLRVEHQLLAGLTDDGGVLFGIRVECHQLRDVIRDPAVRRGLGRALRTMSEPVAAYKGLASVRAGLLRIIEEV